MDLRADEVIWLAQYRSPRAAGRAATFGTAPLVLGIPFPARYHSQPQDPLVHQFDMDPVAMSNVE